MSINHLILQHLIRLCLDAEYLQLREFGILPEDVERLLSLSAREQSFLSDRIHGCVRLHLDREKLEAAIRIAKARSADEDLQDALIRRGASGPMLRSLFGMHDAEAVRRRRTLGVELAGRPATRAAYDDLAFIEMWNTCEFSDLAHRVLHMCEQTSLSAAVVWALLREFELLDSPPEYSNHLDQKSERKKSQKSTAQVKRIY